MVPELEETVQDIHNILKSYYKVARKRFIDNMCMQAADYYLVTGPAAPMKLFSPSWVYNLSREQLDQIAGGGSCPKEASPATKAGEGARNWQKNSTLADRRKSVSP